MDQEDDMLTMPPFWLPNGDGNNRHRRRLRRSYSLLLTSTSLLFLLLVITLVFGLIIVPTLHSFASSILRPHTVKNSWDSLNLVLVLFAIVCGFLSKTNTNENETQHEEPIRNAETPPSYWYNYSDRSFNRLRSFNSHPDLRQYSSWNNDDEPRRFYDDTNFLLRHRKQRLDPDEDEEVMSVEKVVKVDSVEVATAPELEVPPETRRKSVRRNIKRTYQVETVEKSERDDLVVEISQPPQVQQQPESQPLPETRRRSVRRNVKRTYQAETIEKPERDNVIGEISQPPLPPEQPEPQLLPTSSSLPPATLTKGVGRNVKQTYQAETIEKAEVKNSQPPPPPPPPPPSIPVEGKTLPGKKKRGSATKEFLISLRGKKKKQRQKSVDNFDSILNSEPSQALPSLPASQQPSVFQDLFSSKKSKNKKSNFVSVATQKPQLPNKREHSYNYNSQNNVSNMVTGVSIGIGNESPLIPIPPPPPPPPFKLPAWKFRVKGDFVRIDSIGSSRSGSPDLDEVVESPTSQQEETSQSNSPYSEGPSSATASAASLFCPSPDVDTKAHNFIESFRAGLRMARINSMKEKQVIGRSNLGPSPNLNHT